MRTPSITLSLCALLVAALPVAGQEGAVNHPAAVEHAQLGVLEAVGVGNNRVIIALPGKLEEGAIDRDYESFDTNEETLVQGLGSLIRVNGSLAPYVGDVVVVRYVERGEHFVAKRVDFMSDRAVHETRGVISSIDQQKKVMVLKNAEGGEETMYLGEGAGAVIDSNIGLRRFSDLRSGQEVTVYFGPAGRAALVRIG